MHEQTIERYKEMEGFVRDYVSRADYEIDENATLVIDPEKRGFPKGKAEREDLYRRLVHFQMSNYVANGEPLDEAKKKLIHRYELMTRRAQETKRDEIYARFLDAFSTSLDPHSSYLSPDNLEDFKIHMGLSLEGIGAVLSSRDGYTVVEEIVPGGSAAKEGTLKPKDKVIAVAQDEKGEMVDVIDMDLRDVVRMIRGKKGSVVRLSLLRQGATTDRYTVRLVRDKINLEEQAAKLRFEEVEVRRQDLQARRARPAVLLWRQGHRRASGHRRRAEAAEGSARREGGRAAARSLAQRRRPARLRREDHRLLHRQGRRGGGRRFPVTHAGARRSRRGRSSGRDRSWC